MGIQKVASFNVNQVQALNKVNKNNTNPIKMDVKPDTFEKTSATYDKEAFMAELKNIKDKKGKSVYNAQHLTKITDNIDKDPAKYAPLKALSAHPNMRGKDLVRLSQSSVDNLVLVEEFAKKNNAEGKPKYATSHLIKFSELPTKNLERILPLTNTSMHPDGMICIANDDKLNIEKLSKKIVDLEEACGKHTISSVSFAEDIYDPNNAYTITGETKAGKLRATLLDKNLDTLAVDETTHYISKNNTEYEIRKTNDYRNNTISMVRSYIDDEGYPNVQNQVRIQRDKNGKTIKTEYMTTSEVKGVYDIKNVYPNGKVEQVSSGKIDKKTGIVSVKRDMKSLDGTRTEYLYENDPQGNRIIDYKITDENGKTLLNYSQSFEVIDDNHFVSSKNGEVYDIKLSNDKNILTVTDKNTNKENKLNLGKMLRGDKAAMISLLKKFPGEELINLKDTTKILKGASNMEDCCYWPDKREIDIVDDLYSVLHELGHAKDFDTGNEVLTGRKDVQEVFDKEREAFNKAFPNAQRDHINYFIDVKDHYSGFRGGLEETVAESNAILNSYNGQMDIAARAQYMQQYFPKTIAKLSTLLFK